MKINLQNFSSKIITSTYKVKQLKYKNKYEEKTSEIQQDMIT